MASTQTPSRKKAKDAKLNELTDPPAASAYGDDGEVLKIRKTINGMKVISGMNVTYTAEAGLICICGDSRAQQSYVAEAGTAASVSVSGNRMTIAVTGIGNRYLSGEELVVSYGGANQYYRIKVDTTSSDSLSGLIVYPSSIGSVSPSPVEIYPRGVTPVTFSSPMSWMIALAQGYWSNVMGSGIAGARIQHVEQYQVPDMIRAGVKEAWIHVGYNNYGIDGESASTCITRYQSLIAALNTAGIQFRFFLEPPIAANTATIKAINAWAISTLGDAVVDIYTPALGDSLTGARKTNYARPDAIHWSYAGSKFVAIDVMKTPNFVNVTGRYKASAADAGTAYQVNPNPTFSGALGNNIATGYTFQFWNTGGVAGTDYTLTTVALPNGGQGLRFSMLTAAITGNDRYLFCQNPLGTVVPGTRYSVKYRMSVVGALNVDYFTARIRDQAGASLKWVVAPQLYNDTNGQNSADGTYDITINAQFICPAGTTQAAIMPEVYFETGSSMGMSVTFSDFEMRPII